MLRTSAGLVQLEANQRLEVEPGVDAVHRQLLPLPPVEAALRQRRRRLPNLLLCGRLRCGDDLDELRLRLRHRSRQWPGGGGRRGRDVDDLAVVVVVGRFLLYRRRGVPEDGRDEAVRVR